MIDDGLVGTWCVRWHCAETVDWIKLVWTYEANLFGRRIKRNRGGELKRAQGEGT